MAPQEPQSGGVKSWGLGVASRPGSHPQGWFRLSPISIVVGVRLLASSGGRKAAGKKSRAWVLVLPLLFTCSVTPEKDPTLSGPQFSCL